MSIFVDFVRDALLGVNAIKRQYNTECIMRDWRKGFIPQAGSVLDAHVVFYFHGYGCRISRCGRDVDFDFVDDGFIGFDDWKLWNYVEQYPDRYSSHQSKDDVDKAISAAHRNKIITKAKFHRGYYYLTDQTLVDF